jgi:spore coat assemly protein
MSDIKIGDIVARKSYDSDIFFRVVEIQVRDNVRNFIIKGVSYRIQADAPESDLILINEYNELKKKECEVFGKSKEVHTIHYRKIL